MKLESIMSVTDYFSASLCHFSAANIVKVEDNAKQKTKFFVFIVEAPPIFATSGKLVKVEDNAKQKTKFFVSLCWVDDGIVVWQQENDGKKRKEKRLMR